MRDFQGTKVCRAISESVGQIKDYFPTDESNLTIIRAFCDNLTMLPWFRAMFPFVKEIEVTDGRRRRYLCGELELGKKISIKLPKPERKISSLLHALSFALDDGYGHSPHFCMVYIYLTKKLVSPQACASLVKAFKKHRVNYGPGDSPIEESLKNYLHASVRLQIKPAIMKPKPEIKIKLDRWVQGFALAMRLVAEGDGVRNAKHFMKEAGITVEDMIAAGAEQVDIDIIEGNK